MKISRRITGAIFALAIVSLYSVSRDIKTSSIDIINTQTVGFGTFPLKGKSCYKAVKAAFKQGYRVIDTATYYDNFEPISNVLKKYGRENFYIISKVWPDSHTKERLREDLNNTLKKLKVDYIDAYFLHWPNSKVSIEETLATLDDLRVNKHIRHIGLSNVTTNHLKRALELNIPITWIQVEMHPLYYDPELLAFCKDNGIAVQAWGPLARGRVNEDAEIAKLATKYGKSSSQIALKWIIQNGCLPLPGSKNPKHIQENFDVMDFILTQEDMNQMNLRASQGKRERVTLEMGVNFTDEFDFTYEECWPRK